MGENGNIEFITITDDTKIIDTKLNVKISTPSQTVQKPAFVQNKQEEIQPTNAEIKKEEKEVEEKIDTTNYTQVTKEMLQAYSGRVVE